jgi:AAA family ATP:ADP antiporter
VSGRRRRPGAQKGGGSAVRVLRRFLNVHAHEVPLLAWAWLYLFSIFFAYYAIRPIRDEIGLAGGLDNLPWLVTGTLVGMMIVNPPFSALMARLPRARFIAVTYRFFTLNLILFLALFHATSGQANLWVGRAFFVWTSVFNLFVVSVFWIFMVDVFTGEQGKRLFGAIAAGATIGGIAGSGLAAGTVHAFGDWLLLPASAVFLEVAVFSVRHIDRLAHGGHPHREHRTQPAGRGQGGVFAGLRETLRSPYLLNICIYMLLYASLSIFLYFQQAAIVDRNFVDRASRTAFFANVDLLTNVLTLGAQFFLTGQLLERFGVAVTLTIVPALTVAGFALLAFVPTVSVVMAFVVLRRAGNFAFARPTREVLFTSLDRHEKYRAKSFIDTFVYRFGDQVGTWSSGALGVMNVGIAGTAWMAVPLSVLWMINGWWLGRRQESMAAAFEATAAPAPLQQLTAANEVVVSAPAPAP